MSAFEYNALDTEGRERAGVLEGDTARQIRQLLREQGLTPLSVQELGARASAAPQGGSRRSRAGLSNTQLALLTRQLATLVRAAVPLEEALRAVAQQTEKSRVANVMLTVRARVMEGHTLAAGLDQFPRVFPELYRATVAAGEQSGHLDVVLERLADYTEERQQLRQKIQLALLYPAILTVTAVAVVAGLLAYVVPQVLEVFVHIDAELPWLTRALIAVSDFLSAWGPALLVGLALLGAAGRYALRAEHVRLRAHRLLLRLPLISRLVRGVNTARFARTFSILVASGVPILEAFRIAAQVLSNLAMRRAVETAAWRVREGTAVHRALGESGYLPPLTLHMIASGEASGDLEGMLERAAIAQERELETLAATLVGVLEPALILVMAGLVLVIVLAILLPIFELNQLVQ